jgi:hypothetical protein
MRTTILFPLVVTWLTPTIPATVYYRDSGYLVKYHATDHCWGLRRCNTYIRKRTPTEAKKRRQKPCTLRY